MAAFLMLQIAVFVLSLCLLGSLIGNVILYSKYESIREEKDKISKEKDKAESFKKNLISIGNLSKLWTNLDRSG